MKHEAVPFGSSGDRQVEPRVTPHFRHVFFWPDADIHILRRITSGELLAQLSGHIIRGRIVRLSRCGMLLCSVVAFLSRVLVDQLQANSQFVSKPKEVGAERVDAVIVLLPRRQLVPLATD